MKYSFEEIEITINGRKFLVDGELELWRSGWNSDRLIIEGIEFSYIADPETECSIPLCIVNHRLIHEAINDEFETADSPLYNDALAFWEDRK